MERMYFKTHRDVNGNSYYIIIDTESRIIYTGYNLYDEGIFIAYTSKKRIRQMIDNAKLLGYKEI